MAGSLLKKPEDISIYNAKTTTDAEGNESLKGIKISQLKILELLAAMNFSRLDLDNTFVFIRNNTNRIIEIDVEQIKDAFEDYLDAKPFWFNEQLGINRDMIKEMIITNISTYFSRDKLFRLRSMNTITLQQDELTKKYFYFKNGFVEIDNRNMGVVKPYTDLKNVIWENQIIPREFIISNEISVAEKFFCCICDFNDKRMNDLMIITGYLLHDYYEYKRKGIILTDSTISEGDEANGRTGKSLYSKMLSYVLGADKNASSRVFVDIPGKTFDLFNKHRYQDCMLETKIVCINDLKKNFDVDMLYNDVTEGITVEKKGAQPYLIQSKLLMTTNKTVRIEGSSSKDRFLEFEFSNFFNEHHSPEMEFGHWFFRDWDSLEWNRFYNFFVKCVFKFLQNGSKLIKPDEINLRARKFKDETSAEFVEWFKYKFEFGFMKTDVQYNKSDLYSDFVNVYTDYRNDKFKVRRFVEWLRKATEYHPALKPIDKIEDEHRDSSNRYITFRSK
jgi:hypothetical protein